MHPEIIGKGISTDLEKGKNLLIEVHEFLGKMKADAKALLGLTINTLQGPHGIPATKTIQSVSMLIGLLDHYHHLIASMEVDPELDLKSLLTLVNEHVHSTLRLRVETPTVLDCAQDFIRAVIESVKRQTLCGYHYFTSQKRTGYETPSGLMKVNELPKLNRNKICKMSDNQMKALLTFRERFGKGVRQRSVRSDTTKHNAGTLPINLYMNNPNATSWNKIAFPNTDDDTEAEQAQSDNENTTVHLINEDNYPAHDVGDVVIVLLSNSVYLAVIVDGDRLPHMVHVELYKETSGLQYVCYEKTEISDDCIVEQLNSTMFTREMNEGVAEITLNEDVYNRVKELHSIDSNTINEQIEEVENEIDTITVQPETRRRRRVPTKFSDYYFL